MNNAEEPGTHASDATLIGRPEVDDLDAVLAVPNPYLATDLHAMPDHAPATFT